MKTASMLINPQSYQNGYNFGIKGIKRSNPYDFISSKSKYEDWEDGFNDGFFEQYKGYYVEFSHDGTTIERRYFKLSTSAISFASGIQGAQVKIKE